MRKIDVTRFEISVRNFVVRVFQSIKKILFTTCNSKIFFTDNYCWLRMIIRNLFIGTVKKKNNFFIIN